MSWLDAFKKIIGTVQQAGMPVVQRPAINFVSGATVVDNAANNSTDVTVTASASAGQTTNTLTNGLNSNIPTSNLPTLRFGGPSAAYSIGGFSPAPAPGTVLTVINTTSQPMTVQPNDAGSTAACRITTQSGAPFVMPARPSSAVFIYDGSTSRWVLQNQGEVQPVVTHHVRDYGAVGNGNFQKSADLKWYVDSAHTIEATDDSGAIAAAIAAATADIAAGASAHVRLFGNHYVTTPQQSAYGAKAQAAFFVVPSNCTIDGGGSAFLRLGPGLNAMTSPNPGGWAMLAQAGSISNVTIRGIQFDGNGQSGAPTSQENSFIAFLGNEVDNLLIEGCGFRNQSGETAVIVAPPTNGTLGKNIRVSNCDFDEIGNSSGLADHVALYLQGEGVVISGCNFFNDPATNTISRNVGQGIQVQGIGVSCTGCTFTNMANAFLTGSAFTSPQIESQNIVFAGNTVTLCTVGVAFFQSVGLTLSDIVVSGNSFNISNDPIGQAEAGIECINTNGSNGLGINRLMVSGNTFTYTHDSRWSDTAPTALSFGAVVTSCTVVGNVFEGFPFSAMLFTPTPGFNDNAPTGTTVTADMKIYDLKIHSNTIKDCGTSSGQCVTIECDTTSHATQRLDIRNNVVASTGSAIGVGFNVAVSGDTINLVGNVYQNITTPEQLSSTNGITNHLIGGLIGDNGTTTQVGSNASHTVTFKGLPQLANGQWLYGMSTSPPTAYELIGLDVNNAVRIAPDGDTIVGIGTPASLGSAGAGDFAFASGTSLRWSGAGNTHSFVTYTDGGGFQMATQNDAIVMGTATSQMAFFGAAVGHQPSRAGQLTDSTGGTPGSTIASAGTIFNESTLNNNFASLTQRINALETIIHNLGLSA